MAPLPGDVHDRLPRVAVEIAREEKTPLGSRIYLIIPVCPDKRSVYGYDGLDFGDKNSCRRIRAGFWHIDAAVDISGTDENNLAEIFRCQKIDSVQIK